MRSRGLTLAWMNCKPQYWELKLRYLDSWNAERNQIANQYHTELANVPDIILPELAAHAESVYHQFVIRTHKRDDLQAFLKEQGVGTLIHYPIPPHMQQAYQELNLSKGFFSDCRGNLGNLSESSRVPGPESAGSLLYM